MFGLQSQKKHKRRALCFVGLFLYAAVLRVMPLAADDGVVWQVKPPLHLDEDLFQQVTIDDRQYVHFSSGDDPYQARELKLPMTVLSFVAGEKFVLELHFFDRDPAVVSCAIDFLDVTGATTSTLSPTRKCSYTRLNSEADRSAWFEFQMPAKTSNGGVQLRLWGLQYVGEWRLLPAQPEEAWTAKRARIPKVEKALVNLKKPMALTVSAGITIMGDMPHLQESLDNLSELGPLAKLLGFTSVEGYVPWKCIEPEKEGEFDFRFYDAICAKLKEQGLKLFPLLIVGSAYALPDWFVNSPDNVGMVCLEHGKSNPIQSICNPAHKRHVTRVLQAFGQHFEPMNILEAVRLGPSGNYGESQYPAGGNWGPKNGKMHIHIGWWAGDAYAVKDYQEWLQRKYQTIDALNKACGNSAETAFASITLVLPQVMESKRQRLDFTQWYTDTMSEWCAFWAREARKAMPHTRLYQSAGGWGFREAGTDYVAQAKAMQEIGNGGIRLTNETDSYEQNYYATRLACTAARLYGIGLGFEPASSHTARGVVGRLYEALASNADHWFTYGPNIFTAPDAIAKWLQYAPLLDMRQEPVVDVAVYYPETMNQLDDGAFRNLYAWGFNPRAAAILRVIDVDYLDEHLIREGFLNRYKALIFAWGNVIEPDVLDAIDQWMKSGGAVIYPSFPRGNLETVEGDAATFQRWTREESGKHFFRFKGDMEPPSLYGEFVRNTLRTGGITLNSLTRRVLELPKGDQVYYTVQKDGQIAALNYDRREFELDRSTGITDTLPSYGIALPLH